MTVLTSCYQPPQFNIKEIFRYAGCGSCDESVLALLDECIEECKNAFTYNVCYCNLPVKVTERSVDLELFKIDSKALSANLRGCSSVVLFAATVGLEIDRLIAKYARVSPSKAVMLQAIGAERIESLANAFDKDITKECKKNGLYTKPRFSPGYGDFSLNVQKKIFAVLDCPRKIGLSLNESLLMSPSKSVTAIIGITDKYAECKSSCSLCEKTDCAFRSDE